MRKTLCCLALMLAPTLCRADDAADAARYERCLSQISFNPEAALEAALEWVGDGGGAPAKHCHAIALIATGHAGEAAARLETLAKARGEFGDDVRAEMLGQAGDAWMIAGDANAAANDFTAAIELGDVAKLSAQSRAAALADRARAYIALQKSKEARADLDASITLVPATASLVTRARLKREAGDRMAALADISHALGIDPKFPEALLERGRLRALSGDKKNARLDFVEASMLAKKGPIADAAQLEMAKLDIRDH